MPKQITQFKLLIVTPADVMDERNLIQETVEMLNQMYGMINNADIKIQYWAFEHPNQTFAEFDAVIAVFWTQFGTSVEDRIDHVKAEIEAHMAHPEQFFLYFSERQVSPLQTDSDPYRQVLKFKSKYIKMSNCWTYNTLDTFKRLVSNQLTLYFVAQLNTLQIASEPKMSALRIVGVIEDQIIETPKIFRHRFVQSKFVSNYKQKTFDLLDKINTLNLLLTDSNLKEIEASDPSKSEGGSKDDLIENEILNKRTHTIRNFPGANIVKALMTEPVQINAKIQELIIKHLETIDKKIEVAEFFNVGNLMERLNPLRGVQYGNIASSQLIGNAHEKKKYLLIMELYANIVVYKQSYAYLSEIDALFYLQGVLVNEGNDYDEDIDVKLYFDKGYLCKKENLPVPGEGILEIMNPSLELFYKPHQVNGIELYSEYPEDAIKSKLAFYGDQDLGRKQKSKSIQEIYQQKMEMYFCYEYSQEGEFDVLKYQITSIKQNTQIAFPTYLVFKREPRRMKYEISSKHSPDVIQRELSIIRSDR
ncbi:hypothetical protein [Fusibacter sp. 3D3]|uniref:hypothetical protein n=1 Tax=Fusibacter sp. 3D3 TaxID=1048380 RepID=UPI000853C84C|nr:hypothetical protein [Fusibacter sp. 3D3]GAU79302.1 hypothetical protein F3D3_3961 [Fusibacter sp. 3D3]